MLKIILIIGVFSAAIVGRIASLAVRSSELPQHERTGLVGATLNVLSLPAFIALIIIGFSEFTWWTWILIILGMFVLSNLGIAGNNYDAGRRLVPAFSFATVATGISAALIWFNA